MDSLPSFLIEEVSFKWMDRPSVTEMDRGGGNEMNGQTKCQKKWKCH